MKVQLKRTQNTVVLEQNQTNKIVHSQRHKVAEARSDLSRATGDLSLR